MNRDGQTFETSVRYQFTLEMVKIIQIAHRMASNDPTLPKRAKEAGQLVDKLLLHDNLLRGSDIEVLRGIRWTITQVERLKEHRRPKHLDKITRWQFIDGLVDAVEAAGGHLGLDRPNGRGTLDEAIKVLRPCLPKDAFRLGLSISTLKAIKAERAKKLQKTV